MKTKIYKSRFWILFVLSMLLFYASVVPTLKYTFYAINIVSALFLINNLRKT